MAGLILWCDALELIEPRMAAGGDDQAKALFRTVLEQVNALICLSVYVIDDMLDISRLEAGHELPLATAEVDLELALESGRLAPTE